MPQISRDAWFCKVTILLQLSAPLDFFFRIKSLDTENRI